MNTQEMIAAHPAVKGAVKGQVDATLIRCIEDCYSGHAVIFMQRHAQTTHNAGLTLWSSHGVLEPAQASRLGDDTSCA